MSDCYKNKYRIESNRFKCWDYSNYGHYFITMVTHDRINYFGSIRNGMMALNEIGTIVDDEFKRSFVIRLKEFWLTEYVMMPNHIHAIVTIKKNKPLNSKINAKRPDLYRLPNSLSSFIGTFKSSALCKVDDWIDSSNIDIPKFNKNNPLWQPNYHDHIIRNETEFNNISNYIRNNPLNWKGDSDYDNDFII